jgi:di/tricarboxylate transporter
MTAQTVFVFVLLAVTVVLFVSDRIRLDVVALLVILALLLSGVLTPDEALAGFGDPVVLLIAGLFVVGEALVRTGIAWSIGQRFVAVAGDSPVRLLVLLMLAVAALSSVMSSTGAVAIFIPVALNLAGRLSIAPSRLLMPIAFASLIGGMLTLIGTPPNLIVSTQLQREGLAPFDFFAFTPIGLLILAIGTLYLLLVGQRMLPARDPRAAMRPRRSLTQLAQSYDLEDRLLRLRMQAHSPLIGETVATARLRSRFDVTVLGVLRRQRRRLRIIPALVDTRLEDGDELFVAGGAGSLERLAAQARLEPLPLSTGLGEALVRELGMAELLLTPQSRLIGHSIEALRFRTRYRLSVIGIRRGGVALVEELGQTTLQFGDSLLVAGGWQHIAQLLRDQDDFFVLVIPEEMDDVAPNRDRAPVAIAIVALMLLLLATNLVASVTAVLVACLAMVMTRCVRMDEAYRSIRWESLVLIAGMLPMATALQKSGGIEVAVALLLDAVGGAGPLAMMAMLFAMTCVLSQFISNTATTVLLAPVAVAAADALSVSPQPLLMTVAIAASCAFATPVASPVNTLVLGPGGYRFNDFVRVGVPLQLLVMATALLVVPLLFPL